MTHFNSEGLPEGESDDRGHVSWSELDWQHFLHRQEKEIGRFLRHYETCLTPDIERLDWVARKMGWDSDDWSVTDIEDDEDESGEEWKEVAMEDEDSVDIDPYTVHRHPVFVVSIGLFMQTRHLWRNCLEQQGRSADALLNWDFAEVLTDAERHVMLSMQCMEMGDFMLCIVHLKRALKAINTAMHLFPALFANANHMDGLRADMLRRLFDLREVFLRVIRDCRGEDPKD